MSERSSHAKDSPANDGDTQKARRVTSAPPPTAPHTEKAFFGALKQDAPRQQHPVFNDDYEERFAEDAYCEETAPNARVWRTYVEEAAAFDAVMVGQSRDGLDVMLVFAGLFSAVVTSFLVQISQKLEADFSEMSAILMHDLVLVQLSMAMGSSSPNITAPSVDPTVAFSPDALTVWINGLWALSLAASLVVALAAVLVKQWLHHYSSLPSGTAGTRSHVRQYRFMGLQKWRVSVIIGLLPIVMHTSLALFLAGLILFFVPLRTSLAWAIGVITVIVTVLYFVSNAMSIFFPQCPYQTPLTDFAHYAFLAASSIRQDFFTRQEGKSCIPLRESEAKVVSDNYDTLSVDALGWLFDVSSNPSVHSVVVQAIGGLPDGMQPYTTAIWRNQDEMRRVRNSLFALSADPLGSLTFTSTLVCLDGCENVCDRLNRSSLFLPRKAAENSTERWFEVFDDCRDEPRFRASLWLNARSMLQDANATRRALREFISCYCYVQLHRLVWVHLVELAISCDMLAPEYLDDSTECATVIDLCFHAARGKTRNYGDFKGKPLTFEHVFSIQPTLKDIRGGGVQKETDVFFQDHLLKMLSIHDTLPPSFSPSHRLVLAVGKFGVSHVARYFSPHWDDSDGWRHLYLVDRALDYLCDILHNDYSGHGLDIHPEQEFIQSIFHFLISVIDTTPVCDYKPQYWENTRIKDDLVHCLRQTIRLCGVFMEYFALPPALLKRLLHVPAQHLAQDLGIWRLRVSPRDLNHVTEITLGVLSSRLADGDEGVYRAFVDGDWLTILSESWVVDMNKQNCFAAPARPWFSSASQLFTMHGYIHGLPCLPSEVRDEFVEYILAPRNLVILFLMVATDESVAMQFYVTTPRTKALMRVCPGHASWARCYATLKSVLEWSWDPDGVQFPLEGFFEGRVVKLSDVEISLDDQLRMMLGQDHVRARLELAEEYVLSDLRAN